MNSRYYNYSINMNGKKIKHGFEYNKDYYPDLIANDSVAFLRQSKHNFARKPVMLVASFPAPHGPEDSAPQFSNLFFNVSTHQSVYYHSYIIVVYFFLSIKKFYVALVSILNAPYETKVKVFLQASHNYWNSNLTWNSRKINNFSRIFILYKRG